MKSAKLFLLFLSIIILNNCSHHKVKIEAVASPDQMVDYKGVVTSEMKHAVSLAYYELGILNNKAKFMIIVENYGDKPIDFSNDNISVMFEGNSIDWSSKIIEIETPVNFMKDIQREIEHQKMMTKRSIKPGFFDALTHISSGYDKVDYGWAMKKKKEALMDARIMRTLKIELIEAQGYYAIPRVIIRPPIIMPNESISGIFVCDTSEMKDKLKGNFIISIRVDEEEHKFIFSRS